MTMRHAMLASVLVDLEAERKRQDAQWGGADHDDRHDSTAWWKLLVARANMAHEAALHVESDLYRRRLIQMAALAVAAVESFDRHPMRRRILD